MTKTENLKMLEISLSDLRKSQRELKIEMNKMRELSYKIRELIEDMKGSIIHDDQNGKGIM